MSLDGIDIGSPSTREVNEYTFYSNRLKPIDYEKIIARKQKFFDPYWPADES